MTNLPSLKDAYAKYFKIGAAVSGYHLPLFGDILKEHFNSLTCENAMKPEPMQPQRGVWNFGEADRILSFAKEMQENSLYYREGVEFDESSRILTLSTCKGGFNNKLRYTVQAVLVDITN